MPPKKNPEDQRTLKEYAQSDLKSMEERLMTAITGVKENISGEIEKCRREIADARGDLQQLNEHFSGKIENLRKETKSETQALRDDIERLEWHQRKYNLIFSGMTAKRGEEEEAVSKLLTEKLDFDEAPQFVNVHAIGKPDSQKATISIIARLQKWTDRQLILKNAVNLKGTGIGVKTDLPARLQNKREKLLQKRKEMKDSGAIVRIVERNRDVLLQTKASETAKWVTVE